MDNISDGSSQYNMGSVVESTGRAIAKGLNSTLQTTIDTYDVVKDSMNNTVSRRSLIIRPPVGAGGSKIASNKVLIEG